ncbi:MAG: cbb3-type cytochrome c oxidase subunit I [Candidatus Kapabacteria bacterium]|nr:cbb3-type cytochrome c oxidase subunit I [Candidatus Kapabacteria bacterium]
MEAIAVEHSTAHSHDAHDHGHGHHHAQSFIRKYIFSNDHKVIAKQFMVTTIFFLFVGGLAALLVRWKIAYPDQAVPILGSLLPNTWVSDGVIEPGFYSQLLTMHGAVMLFLVIIPMVNGMIGNFAIPLMIGTDDMALPTLNMFSFWLNIPAAMLLMGGFVIESGMAQAGWTAYPPLSAIQGLGQTMWIAGLFLVGFASIMGAINYVTTILNKRAKGMTLFRMPMTIWALFVTAVLITLGTPVLAAALAMLFFDNFFHSSFFIPYGMLASSALDGSRNWTGGGQPLLFQHLFWFYSHPAVYIMILPSMGVVSDVIATFSRKPIYGYKAMIFALMAIGFLGFIVWGHHMFQSGMSPLLGTTFVLSTIVIAVPSAIKVFNWLGTLWGGSIRYTSAMLCALAFVSMFIIGGLSGIFMASAAVDIFIHDTYFIVAHFHYVLFGASLFGVFASIYYWFPKMFGKMMSETWGRRHFFWSFVFFNLTFFPMHIIGLGGHMRRIADPTVYDFLKPFQPMNEFITWAAIALGFSQFFLVFNIFWSLKYGKPAPRNPWNANSLEWAAPEHPGHGNFDTDITVYRGPYEFSQEYREQDYWEQWVPPTEEEKKAEAAYFEAHKGELH